MSELKSREWTLDLGGPLFVMYETGLSLKNPKLTMESMNKLCLYSSEGFAIVDLTKRETLVEFYSKDNSFTGCHEGYVYDWGTHLKWNDGKIINKMTTVCHELEKPVDAIYVRNMVYYCTQDVLVVSQDGITKTFKLPTGSTFKLEKCDSDIGDGILVCDDYFFFLNDCGHDSFAPLRVNIANADYIGSAGKDVYVRMNDGKSFIVSPTRVYQIEHPPKMGKIIASTGTSDQVYIIEENENEVLRIFGFSRRI